MTSNQRQDKFNQPVRSALGRLIRSCLGWGAIRIAVVFGVAPFLGSCGSADACGSVECSPCPLYVSVEIVDGVTGTAVEGALASGGELVWTCQTVEGKRRCRTDVQVFSSELEVTVVASGYQEAKVVAKVERSSEGCCSCSFFPVTKVSLVPLASTL